MSEARLTGEAVAALLNTRLEGITDQIAKDCPLFNDLKAAGRLSFGKGWVDGVEIKVHTTNSLKTKVVSIADWQQAKAAVANDKVTITFPGSNLVFSMAKSAIRDERLDNLDDKTKVFDLMLEEMHEGQQALMETFCEDLYNDGTQRLTFLENTLTPLVGLPAMIDDANSYGYVATTAIDRTVAANAYWKSKVQTVPNGGDFLNMGNVQAGEYDGVACMQAIADDIQIQGDPGQKGIPNGLPTKNQDFDAVYCDKTSFKKYRATFNSRMMFTPEGKHDARNAVTFDGKPVKKDAFCAAQTYGAGSANTMYFIRWKSLELWSVKKGGEVFSVICKDNTNLVGSIVMNSQHAMFTREPRALGKVKTVYRAGI